MGDLYNIPNDNGKDYRLKKFVEYQHEAPSIHYRFLGEFIKRNRLSKDEAIDMCFLLSATYNELTAILLFNMLKDLSPNQIWTYFKNDLLFGSARKYVKNNDQLVGLLLDWRRVAGGRPFNWVLSKILGSEEETYKNIHKSLRQIKNEGRFAADIFMETLVYLKDWFGLKLKEPYQLDWNNCANLTSGIFNIFYEDEAANRFDKTKRVPVEVQEHLSKQLEKIQSEIRKTYPEQDSEISMFVGKICSFRNLFKNARYGGFHHDRQLGWLREYEKTFPEYRSIWEECYKIREDIFPDRFLGEKHGWDGVRPWRKKIWLTTGKTGVEYDGD